MSLRRCSVCAAVLLAALAVTAFSAGPIVGVVLKDGRRFSGMLVAQRADRVWLEIDNRQYSWSPGEIAVIEFVPGRAARREMSELSSVPGRFEGGPAAAVAMQDGQMIVGRFGGIQDDGRLVAFSTGGRNRADVSTSHIARLYLDPEAARRLYESNAVVDAVPEPERPAANISHPLGPFNVDGRAAWVRTGVVVRQGERVSFEASGQVRWGQGREQVAGPEGADNPDRVRRDYPVPQLGAGALVGRVEDSQPFAIGASRDPIVMPAGGELYLGINDNLRSDNGGGFSVRVIPDTRYPGRPGGAREEGYGQGYGQGHVDFADAVAVRVDARQEWGRTGVTVRRGDWIAFQATGQIAWGQGATQRAGPEGAPMEASVRRDYPVPSAGVGALVAKVDGAAPFLVGASTEPIVMPADGELYLGVNDNRRSDNSGFFQVRIAQVRRRAPSTWRPSGQGLPWPFPE